eukprot:TRINITY_DN1022_c0_g2_i1.p1 TRINITY_DN1022_c0_g2~~TRINITY_DN1022_c0_g2_i1.p1  ORF type:complete len:433 (+),score=35.93 TRINITY_DN1022_c0_g2_i1:360-1658(+)
MAVPLPEPLSEDQADRYPLLMERPVNHHDQEHVIDMPRGSVASSSGSNSEDRSSSNTRAPVSQSSSFSSVTSNSRNTSFMRRGDSYGRRNRRSPLNSGLWISIELVITVTQIIASIVVLSLSRHEKPKAPLFVWVVGYASGCVATLPFLYWRYTHRNSQAAEQESTRLNQGSARTDSSLESPYAAISLPRAPEVEDRHSTTLFSWNLGNLSLRLNMLIDHLKMGLDCFFAVWFVVGNVWIFGGHSSSSDAPNLYRLCLVFLTFSCIGYAMPFLLCAALCCCFPCIISVLGFRDDLVQTRGATQESISVLPTYKFKLKRNGTIQESEINLEGAGEGGIVGFGTDRERIISAEDAVCCICLAKYTENEELRELPCAHFFHMECVDKWLKINDTCPLCKCEVGGSAGLASSVTNPGRRRGDRRTGNGVAYGYFVV